MMKKIGIVIIIPLLVCVPAGVNAEEYSTDEILTIEAPVSEGLSIEFSERDDLRPISGDFKVLSVMLMSNPAGERWATLTIKNTSAHQRLLEEKHIMAIFANGERRYPVHARHTFSGNEAVSLVVSFAESKFPIIRVMVAKQ